MNEQLRSVLKYMVVLFVITAVVAGLLAGFDMLTKDAISQNEVKAEQEALSDVIKDADSFTLLESEDAANYEVDAVYAAYRGADLTGFCVKVSQSGYNGKILSMVGVDLDGKVTGVHIISHSETPGLGSNITKSAFLDQFIGKGAQDDEISAVTGATVSSKAVAESVAKAVAAAVEAKEQAKIDNRQGRASSE